jgi:hypothetical protein
VFLFSKFVFILFSKLEFKYNFFFVFNHFFFFFCLAFVFIGLFSLITTTSLFPSIINTLPTHTFPPQTQHNDTNPCSPSGCEPPISLSPHSFRFRFLTATHSTSTTPPTPLESVPTRPILNLLLRLRLLDLNSRATTPHASRPRICTRTRCTTETPTKPKTKKKERTRRRKTMTRLTHRSDCSLTAVSAQI